MSGGKTICVLRDVAFGFVEKQLPRDRVVGFVGNGDGAGFEIQPRAVVVDGDGHVAASRARIHRVVERDDRAFDQRLEAGAADLQFHAHLRACAQVELFLARPISLIVEAKRHDDARFPGGILALLDGDLVDRGQVLDRGRFATEVNAKTQIRHGEGVGSRRRLEDGGAGFGDEGVGFERGVGVGDVPEFCPVVRDLLREHVELVVLFDHVGIAGGGGKRPQLERGDGATVGQGGLDRRDIYVSGIFQEHGGGGLDRDQLDDLLGGVGQVGDRLRFLGDGGEHERARGQLVVRARVGVDHADFDVDVGLHRVEQEVVLQLADSHRVDRHREDAGQAPDEKDARKFFARDRLRRILRAAAEAEGVANFIERFADQAREDRAGIDHFFERAQARADAESAGEDFVVG